MICIRRFWVRNVGTVLIIAALVLGIQRGAAFGQTTKVTIGVEFINARLAGLWVAEKEGFFKKQGLDINTVNISGGTQGAQAMMSGELDLSFSAPAATIPAVAAGAQILEIMPTTSTMPYYLVGAPTITSIPALKGQRVGASGLGLSASRLALLVVLKHFGLDPDKDKITVVAAGREPERMAAVTSGAIGATVVAPEFSDRVEKMGAHLLADLRTLNIPWENDGLATTRKSLQSKREILERVVKALLQANAFVLNPANRAKTIEILNGELKFKDSQEANSVYNDLIKYYMVKKPYPYRDGILTVISEVAKVLPKASGLKFEDVADNSIMEKLDKSGYIDGLYK
jgi:ABC-type nitrate/sulfonate/bicarbonate transport system substrate-binding protein